MRTEFVLMARTGRSYTSVEVSRHRTPMEARHAAGHPASADWTETASPNSAVLREEVRAARYENDLPWLIVAEQVAETDDERIVP